MLSIPRLRLSQLSLPTRLTLCLLFLALAWDISGWDLAVMRALADNQGFVLRHAWLLEQVLHNGVHDLSILCYLAMLAMIWWPLGPLRQLSRLDRVEIFCGLTLNLILVGVFKGLSHTSCPYDLAEFGSQAPYVSHWDWSQIDGGPGRCFPGGHVSSALAWLALSLPWLRGNPAQQRLGRLCLWAALLGGLLLGVSQTLRGAHFPSHTWWTALLCWLGALANQWLFAWGRKRRATRANGLKPQ